jgi:hypothetical protein
VTGKRERGITFRGQSHRSAIPAAFTGALWSGELQPGGWVGNTTGGTGTEADRRYQRQITGRTTSLDYQVTRGGVSADFDGYKRGVLLDAENLPRNGGMARMFQWMQKKKVPPPERLRAWAEQQLEEARRQVQVAAGTPIVWHVSSNDGARCSDSC